MAPPARHTEGWRAEGQGRALPPSPPYPPLQLSPGRPGPTSALSPHGQYPGPKAPPPSPPPDLDPRQKVQEQGWGGGGSTTSPGLWPQSELFSSTPPGGRRGGGAVRQPGTRGRLLGKRHLELPVGQGQGPRQGAPRDGPRHVGTAGVRNADMALTPGAGGPGRCSHSCWPSVGHATDQDTPGPGQGGGTSGQQRTGTEGAPGDSEASSQPRLLPGLIILRPTDHTPTLSWPAPAQTCNPASQRGVGQRGLAMQASLRTPQEGPLPIPWTPGGGQTSLGGVPRQAPIQALKTTSNVTSSLKPP